MKQFVVLYTHQITKKAKVWQDGTLRFPDTAGSRGLLYDDKNNRIDVIHVKASQLEPGSELQADRHLIQVEEEMVDTLTNSQTDAKPQTVSSDPAARVRAVSSHPAARAQTVSSVPAARSATSTTTGTAAAGGAVQGGQGPTLAAGPARSGLSKKRKGFVPPRPSKRAFLSQCTESPPPRSPQPSPPTSNPPQPSPPTSNPPQHSPPTPNPLGTFPDLYPMVGQNPRNPQLESEIRKEASSLLKSGFFEAFSQQKNALSPSLEPSGSKWGKFTDAENACSKSDSGEEGNEDSELDTLIGPPMAASLASKWAYEKNQSVKRELSVPGIDKRAPSDSGDINVVSKSVGNKWGKFADDEIGKGNLDSEDEMMPIGLSGTNAEKPKSEPHDTTPSVNQRSPILRSTVGRSEGNKWGKFTSDETDHGDLSDTDEDSQIDALLGETNSLGSNSVKREPPIQIGLDYERELMISPSPKPHVNSTSILRPSDESFEISEVPFWLLEGSGDGELTQLDNDDIVSLSHVSDCADEIKVEVGDDLVVCKVIADDSEHRIHDSPVMNTENDPEKAGLQTSEAICCEIVEEIVLRVFENCCSLDSKSENFSTLESDSVVPETPLHEQNDRNSEEPKTPENNNEIKRECESPSYSPRLDISSDTSISLDEPSQIAESLDYNSILKEDEVEIEMSGKESQKDGTSEAETSNNVERDESKDINSQKVIIREVLKLDSQSIKIESSSPKTSSDSAETKNERSTPEPEHNTARGNQVDCVKSAIETGKKVSESILNSMLDRFENQSVVRKSSPDKICTENSSVEQSGTHERTNESSAIETTEKKGNALRGEFPTFDLFSSPLVDDILDWDLYGSPVEEVKSKTAGQMKAVETKLVIKSESEQVESKRLIDVEMKETKLVTDVDKIQIIQDNSEPNNCNWTSDQPKNALSSDNDRALTFDREEETGDIGDRLVPEMTPEVGIDARIHGTGGSGAENRKRRRPRGLSDTFSENSLGDPYGENSLVPVRSEEPSEDFAIREELDTSPRDYKKRNSGSSENEQSSLVMQVGSGRRSESSVSSAYPNVEKLFSKIAPPKLQAPARGEKQETTERLKFQSACDASWSERGKMSGSQCSSVARRRPEGLYKKLGLAMPAPPTSELAIPRHEVPTITHPRPRNVLDDLVPTDHEAVLNDVTCYPPITTRDDYDVMRREPTRVEGRYDVISRQPITSSDRRDVRHHEPIPRQDHPDVTASYPITRPDYYDVRTEQPIRRQRSEHTLTRHSDQTLNSDYSDYHISQSGFTDPLPHKVDYDVNRNHLFAGNSEESSDMNEVRQRISADFEKCEQANDAFDSFVGNEGGFGENVRIDMYKSREVPEHPIRMSNFDDVTPGQPIRARDAEQEVLDLEAYLGPDYDDILDSSCDSDRSFTDKQPQHDNNIYSQNISKPMNSVERTLKSVTPSRWTKFVHHEIVERPTPLPYRSRLSSGTSSADDPPASPSGVAQRRPGGFKPPTRVAPAPSLPGGPGRSSGNGKVLSGDLYFPAEIELSAGEVRRQIEIPVSFTDVAHYKSTLVAAINEYLNIGLHQLAKTYHTGLAKVDIQDYIKAGGSRQITKGEPNAPCCEHGVPAKMVQVRKDGPNKGRFFYSCSSTRNQQCKFFQWADLCEPGTGTGGAAVKKVALLDHNAISSYMTKLGVPFYCECSFLRRSSDARIDDLLSRNKYRRASERQENTKKRLYLRLSRREKSDMYAKNDLWIISGSLGFDRGETFLARSLYFGPNTNNEVEIEPISGYSPSNWQNKALCHAIQARNASSELTTISNIHAHIQPRAPPLVTHLLHTRGGPSAGGGASKVGGASRVGGAKGFQTPALIGQSEEASLTEEFVSSRVEGFVFEQRLNCDQAEALRKVGRMLVTGHETDICLVHGVFGAGKSFLLAVMILCLVDLFSALNRSCAEPWRILVSSTTNVAVDRILQWLLELGFSDFVRVGSVKKIAKTVLPYSVHAFGSESQELKELKEMDKTDLSAQERGLIRRSIEHHKLGLNRKKLSSVLVVGATCAACPFPCMDKMTFPVVVLDECSQMTEPASLLPVARFLAKRLVLVGDPQQLGPTLQGSESEHEKGLEQTLFDRLFLMGHESVLLRTQYRCHPRISCVANQLFYRGKLQDGLSAENRPRLVPGLGPAVFLDAGRGREVCGYNGSYHNDAEVSVCVRLIGIVLAELEPESVGVITLYKNQAAKLSAALRDSGLCGSERDVRAIQLSTVDAFQGAERDVIILSFVRTDHVGFIDSDKRTNVALTRARNHLVIVGHRGNLSRNPLWSRVIDYCAASPDGMHDAEQFLSHFRSEETT